MSRVDTILADLLRKAQACSKGFRTPVSVNDLRRLQEAIEEERESSVRLEAGKDDRDEGGPG